SKNDLQRLYRHKTGSGATGLESTRPGRFLNPQAEVAQDAVGHFFDGEVGGDGARVGGKLAMQIVIGEHSLQLLRQVGRIPGAESQAAAHAIDFDRLGDAANVGDDDRCA